MFTKDDEKWMSLALKLAHSAKEAAEVPVGAVLVSAEGELISRGYNLKEKLQSPLGHAELLALHRGATKLKSWRLLGATLYVTLEPCPMCAGALVQARIQRLVFSTRDFKGGGVKSLYQITEDRRLNHRLIVQEGLFQEQSSELLKSFFKEKRKV